MRRPGHRTLATLALACIALHACLLVPCRAGEDDVHSSDSAVDTDPRVLLIGNEMISATRTHDMLDALLRTAAWVHEDTGVTRFFTHLHDGYTLGPNPFATDFQADRSDFLERTFQPTSATEETTPGEVDTKHPKSTLPRDNLTPIAHQGARTNPAALAALTTEPGMQLGQDLLAEGNVFRLVFPTAESVAPLGWLAYDNDTAPSTYGFRGSANSSLEAGIAVFKAEEKNLIDLTNLPLTDTVAPMRTPVWDTNATLSGDFTLSVWASLDAAALTAEGSAPIFDCRSVPAKGDTTPPMYVQLAPRVTEGFAFMEFAYNALVPAADSTKPPTEKVVSASSFQSVTAALPATAQRKELAKKNSIQANTWTHWLVTVKGTTGEVVLYQDGLEVARSTPASPAAPFPVVVRAKCGLGHAFTSDGGGQFLSGKLMDFTVLPRLANSHEAKAIYADRPTQIRFLLPPPAVNYQAVRATKQAHAFCPNTLALFDARKHPAPWSHVILQDHILGPLVPWWQRHSLLPGLAILTTAILRHSPEAKIYLMETWPMYAPPPVSSQKDAPATGFNLTSLGARSTGTFWGAQDHWQYHELFQRAAQYFARAHDDLLQDQLNVADFPPKYRRTRVCGGGGPDVLLTNSTFQILKVASMWNEMAGGSGQAKDLARFYNAPATTPAAASPSLLSFSDPISSQASALPSPTGAFAVASAMYVAVTGFAAEMKCTQTTTVGPDGGEQKQTEVCQGYCPCNLAPSDMFSKKQVAGTDDAASFVESPSDKAARLQKRDEVCQWIRTGVARFTESLAGGGQLVEPVLSTTPVLDEHALCGLPCAAASLVVSNTSTLIADGCRSASASSSTGAAMEAIYPDPDPEPDEGAAGATKRHDTDPEIDGVAPPSLLPLVLIGVLVLVTISAIVGVVWYRQKKVAWELIDSQGYDMTDKAEFDQAALEDDQL